MAISAYVGLPGSGKSYSICEYVVIPALKNGREVWTNIPFQNDLLQEKFNAQVTQFDISDIEADPNWFAHVLPKGVVCVIDECWRLWPSGLKANNANEDHKAFIAEHRHLVSEDGKTTEIVLATQDLSQIAAWVRALVDKTYRTTKLDAVGQNKRFRVDIYQGSVTGPNPPASNRLDQRFGSYKKDIYQFYKSATKSDVDSVGDESKSDNRGNILTGNWLKYGAAFVVVGAILAVWGISSVFDKYNRGFKDESEVAEIPGASNQLNHPGIVPAVYRPKEPPKPENLDFLNGKTLSIASNMGVYPAINYVFTVTWGDNRARLTQRDLLRLGYNIKAINECLVFITGDRSTYSAGCVSNSGDGGLVNFEWGVEKGGDA